MNTVVKIENEQQFNVVKEYTDKIYKRTYSYNEPLSSYGTPFCLDLGIDKRINAGYYSDSNYFTREKYIIISFGEFERNYLKKEENKVLYKYGKIQSGYLLKCIKQEGDKLSYTHYINITDKFYLVPYYPATIAFHNIRDLTQDEIDHLEACITANKYVEPPTIRKQAEIEPVVGEWYEATIGMNRYRGKYRRKSTTVFIMHPYCCLTNNSPSKLIYGDGGFNTIVRKLKPHEIPAENDQPKEVPVDKQTTHTKFQVGDFVIAHNLNHDEPKGMEIAKIEGDKFWLYYNEEYKRRGDYQDQGYLFSAWPNLQLVSRDCLPVGTSDWDYEIMKDVIDRYPVTTSEAVKVLDHQQPILIKQNKVKNRILVV